MATRQDSNSSRYGFEVEEEQPSLIDFWQILRVLQKWWWLILLFVATVTLATAFVLSRSTPVFQAFTIVEIKQEARQIIDVTQVENVIADKEFLTTQVELLKSESLARDVIESLNLISDPYIADLDDENWPSLSRDERMRVLTSRFRNEINVAPVGRTRLIKISFNHADPKKAAQITNEVTNRFIDNSLNTKFNATAFARDFLEERLSTVKASLENAERELVEYASENNIITIRREDGQEGTGSLDTAALITLDAQLTEARSERIAAEIAYTQSLENSFMSNVLDSPAISTLRQDRIALNSEYQEKLATFKPEFPAMLELRNRIELFDEEINSFVEQTVSGQRENSKAAYEAAKLKEENFVRRVANLKNSVLDVREKSIYYNILKREVETERTQYDGLLQRLKEVSVADDLGSNLLQIVDPAQVPLKPFKPNKIRGIILALLFSGALGFGVCYLLEIIDDRVKTPDDVKVKLKQPLMGVIPFDTDGRDIEAMLEDPQSGISEAYASVRTNVKFSGPNGGPRVIQITSTRGGEGKSTTSLGLSLRFAGIGEKVLLIDADMRLPTFNSSVQGSVGLSGLLTMDVDFMPNVKKTKFDNLYLIPAGQIVPNPSEILSSSRFDEILAYARENFTYVIVDCPPVLGLADAPVIGAKVDASIVVVEAHKLRTANVRNSFERLNASGAKILGVVLSKYTALNKGYMDYYQYSYGGKSSEYGPNSKKKKTKASKAKRKLDLN